MAKFSASLDKKDYEAAMAAWGQAGPSPKVTTWELYDKAFSFERVRRYESVQAALDEIEHYEDNLNTNISNSKLVDAFIAHATHARAKLNALFKENGAFKDPGA